MISLTTTSAGSAQASRREISGYVVDSKSGERLPGAVVRGIPDGRAYGRADADGYFYFKPEAFADSLEIRLIGYRLKTLALSSITTLPVTIALEPQRLAVEEVIVSAQGAPMGRATVSTVTFSPAELASLPSFMGQRDVLKSLQFLPGVQAGNEGMAQVFVRGGSHDQTLILLDGVPVFNAFHSAGFISAMHPGILHQADFITGGFHSRYGGRLGGVLDMTLKEGDPKRFHGELFYGALSIDGLVEVPLVKDRTTLIVAGRHSNDPNMLNRKSLQEQNLIPVTTFFDYTAKLTHQFKNNHKLTASFFLADDRLGNRTFIQEWDSTPRPPVFRTQIYSYDLGWRSLAGALHYRIPVDARSFVKITAYHTRYKTENRQLTDVSAIEKYTDRFIQETYGRLNLSNGLQQTALQADYKRSLADQVTLESGVKTSVSSFVTGQITSRTAGGRSSVQVSPTIYVPELEAYASLTGKWGLWDFHTGLRGHLIESDGRMYGSLQPRFNAGYPLAEKTSLKISASYMQQMLHVLVNNGVGVGTELWIPPMQNIHPGSGWVVAGGISHVLWNTIDLSAETYFRNMNHQVDYRQGSSFYTTSETWKNQVVQGEGKAYGLELFARKSTGKIRGSLSYGLSRSERHFEALNRGAPFLFKFDRTHNASATVVVSLPYNFELQTAWTGFSGSLVTTPTRQFQIQPWSPLPFYDPVSSGAFFYPERNNYRLPFYHRLDVSLAAKPRIWKFDCTVQAGLYNALDRRNVVFARYEYEQGIYGMRHLPLYPRLPYFTIGLRY